MIFTTLINAETLAEHLHESGWVIIDCRFALSDTGAGLKAYKQGHIPGARYAHLDDDLSSSITKTSGRHPLPDPHELARKLGQWGIGNDTQVVVYDDIFGAMAVRLWWLLKWLGHTSVALLDGGLPKWQRLELPLVSDPPDIKTTEFAVHLHNDMWVDASSVERIRERNDYLLIDARAEERFTGMIEPLDKVAGHIPGAINYPYEDNLDFSGTFMSKEELLAEYKDLIDGKDPVYVIHMCGSGVTACHNVLAMEHAGLHGSKLYAGSWSEWISDANRPIVKEE